MDLKGNVNSDPRRALPSVNRLSVRVQSAKPELPGWLLATAAQTAIDEVRAELNVMAPGGKELTEEEVGDRCFERALEVGTRLAAPWPRRVINATGVSLHTNLGRAPMAAGAARAAAEAGMHYTDLELDLKHGGRGDRLASVAEKLRLLSAAEAAYACNNNAAAVLLALNSLAADREVIVSRGELVEIGGSFRVPEIMRRAGVELVEVGSTNRTHAKDYEAAIGPRTAMLLKVHRSNFQQTGFVSEVSLAELVRIGSDHGVAVMEDLGSGTLLDLTELGLPPESFAPGRLQAGPDLVCFSGDKLFGGPQAGLVLGKKDAVASMKKNPLARALRLDKMALAALDFTLSRMLDGSAEQEIPVLRQILVATDRLEARTRKFAKRLENAAGAAGRELAMELTRDRVPLGGGSLPGFEVESWVLAIESDGSAEDLASRLRGASVPILSRIRDDRVIIDLRAVTAEDEEALESGLLQSLR
ncbi:MAG: L-seryl-tRNA(Sec) selenium transferase [Myxococcota bacterium]